MIPREESSEPIRCADSPKPETASTIAIVGLSDKPDRDSYLVAEYLQALGFRIVPVNPTVDQVLGIQVFLPDYGRITTGMPIYAISYSILAWVLFSMTQPYVIGVPTLPLQIWTPVLAFQGRP